MKHWLRYDEMVDEALRGVVQRALREAGDKGLPGDHHFYISFKTQNAGVSIPKYLTAKYPEEMTIVLQHQFWDLRAGEDEFSVTLSFNGKPEQLIIPWRAITHFADPSVKFALQFEVPTEALPVNPENAQLALPGSSSGNEEQGRTTTGGAEIVALDQFRNKK